MKRQDRGRTNVDVPGLVNFVQFIKLVQPKKIATLENNLAVSSNIEMGHTLQPGISTSPYLPSRKSIYPMSNWWAVKETMTSP